MIGRCKKCLMAQQAEHYLEMLEKSRAAIRPRDRASDQEFSRRIDVCEACDRLSGATCMVCGCFVELRALRSAARCPSKKW